MNPELLGISAALGSAASWALGSILFKKLGESISSLAMTLAKGGLSIVLLAAALGLVGFESIGYEPLFLLVVSGLLGIAVGDTCFFEALQDLGPHAVVLLMMLGQVLTVVFAVIFLGETPAPIIWFGIALVMSGIGIVLYASISGVRKGSGRRGLAFGLMSAVSMSVSIIIAKKALDSVSALQATFIRMAAGTLGVFVFGMATGRVGKWMLPFKDTKLLQLFVVSVCVITFGGFWLSIVAIKYTDVSIANTLNSTEPLFILPLAVIFLKEKITVRAIAGTVVAILGILLIYIGLRPA